MAHILYKAILIYLEKYNILTDCQRGFRQGRSYETQLVTTLEDIALNMDSGIQTDMLIWCCPCQRLLAKLQYYWIRGNIYFSGSSIGQFKEIKEWLSTENTPNPLKFYLVSHRALYWLPFSIWRCLSMTLVTTFLQRLNCVYSLMMQNVQSSTDQEPPKRRQEYCWMTLLIFFCEPLNGTLYLI